MAIDYHRLVDGLAEATTLFAGGSELVAIESLVTTIRESTGADGASFTEYAVKGGRVIVAQDAMAWALGQPVPEELVAPEIVGHPFAGRVDAMPPTVSEVLLGRGLSAVAGHPVRRGDRVLGALHLFFGTIAESEWADVLQALRLAAVCAAHVYTGAEAAPIRSAIEEDDRSLFLTAAGHELRTPATVLKGYAGLLADRWDKLPEEERREAAQVLSQRADELARLVDRLLGASAGDASRGGLVRTVPFDPVDALRRAANDMPVELRRSLRVELPNWLPPAAGDPDVLGTVVTELVTNAVRASGGPAQAQSSVDLTAGADADTVFIRVCDRGVGIDPAHAERAFERFWRGPRAMHNGEPVRSSGSVEVLNNGGGRDPEARPGIGLGLYLVRRLVERQHGWVSLRPRDGGGTIAEVRLGRADGPPRVAAGRA
jgi:signal transduction histidine kinase